MLQERIEELDSGILDYFDNKIRLTSFLSNERLLDYLSNGLDCRFGVGVYPQNDLNIAYIKDNSLFLILKDGIEVSRYEFNVIQNDTLKYKDEQGTSRSKVYKIRHCNHSSKYNYRDTESSILFDTLDDLKRFLINEYDFVLDL